MRNSVKLGKQSTNTELRLVFEKNRMENSVTVCVSKLGAIFAVERADDVRHSFNQWQTRFYGTIYGTFSISMFLMSSLFFSVVAGGNGGAVSSGSPAPPSSLLID